MIDLELLGSAEKSYLGNAEKWFEKASEDIGTNHLEHNLEPNYWNIMLGDLEKTPSRFEGKSAMEYGCGGGRNLVNMAKMGKFKRVDGIDISIKNANYSRKYFTERLSLNDYLYCDTFKGNGYSCYPLPSDNYHFAICHQVLIHIPNHNIRSLIIKDIKRILLKGGIFVGHFKTIGDSVPYQENSDEFPLNVCPESAEQIYKDFQKFEFSDVEVITAYNYYDGQAEYFVRCVK